MTTKIRIQLDVDQLDSNTEWVPDAIDLLTQMARLSPCERGMVYGAWRYAIRDSGNVHGRPFYVGRVLIEGEGFRKSMADLLRLARVATG